MAKSQDERLAERRINNQIIRGMVASYLSGNLTKEALRIAVEEADKIEAEA